MLIKNDRSNHKLFHTWLLIQLCFMVFMAAGTVGVYLNSNRHIRNQLDSLYISSLKRTQAEITSMLDTASATVNEYAIQPKVRTLAGADMTTVERGIAGLIDDIKQTNATVKGISEIILYFDNGERYISSSGVMDKQIFNEVYAAPDARNPHLSEIIGNPALTGRFVPVYNGRRGNNTAVYTQQAVNGIYVSAIVSSEQINSILRTNQQREQNCACVYTDNTLLFSVGRALSSNTYEQAGANNNRQFQTIHTDNGDFVYLASEANHVRFVLLIDERNYWADHFRIQRIAICLLAASIMLGTGASYVIARYEYKPIETVINVSKKITPSHVFTSSDNELAQIKSAFEYMNAQKEQAASVLKAHETHIRDSYIKMVLDGDIRCHDTTPHVKMLADISPHTTYCVSVFEVGDYTQIDNEIARAKSLCTSYLYIVYKAGRIVAIADTDDTHVISELNTHNRREAIRATIAVGHKGIGETGIKASYESALLNLSRKILPDAPRILTPPSSLEHPHAGAITISTDDEIHLGGCIQSGETHKAIAKLQELMLAHDSSSLNHFSYKSYLYHISNVIVRSAEDILPDEMIRRLLDAFSLAFKQEDFLVISKSLKDAVTTVTNEYDNKKSSANRNLNIRLVRYIESTIADPQLSADMIAQAMSLNPAYIRRFFKEQNGITLWDFINMKRIEQAKLLLVNNPSSIQRIAVSCGYISISTFVRMFKKHSGMTPGHYRNLYR